MKNINVLTKNNTCYTESWMKCWHNRAETTLINQWVRNNMQVPSIICIMSISAMRIKINAVYIMQTLLFFTWAQQLIFIFTKLSRFHWFSINCNLIQPLPSLLITIMWLPLTNKNGVIRVRVLRCLTCKPRSWQGNKHFCNSNVKNMEDSAESKTDDADKELLGKKENIDVFFCKVRIKHGSFQNKYDECTKTFHRIWRWSVV